MAWIGIQLHRIWIDSRIILFAHFIDMELERAIGTSQKELKNIEWNNDIAIYLVDVHYSLDLLKCELE